MHLIVFVVAILLALCALIPLSRIGIPGVSPPRVWAAIVCGFAVAVLMVPYLFWRLPLALRWLAYGALFASFIFTGATLGYAEEAYHRTPAGAKEAAALAESDRVAAIEKARDDERQESEQQAKAREEADQQIAAGDSAKLKRCFSYFGNDIPKLTSQVQESLDNPKSFEHVKTEEIDSGALGYNVEMTFRGQNRFSAIITARLRAKIDLNDCSVADLDKIDS